MATVTAQQIIDAAVEFAVKIANDNTHGYSQKVRSLYNYTNPTSFDCSSLVCTAFQYAFDKYGITPTPKSCGCTYTGNMLYLLKCGFEIVATNQTAHSQMKKGDIELNVNYHTALATDSNNIVHARSSEGTSDTKDNSGNEIRTQAWYLYSKGWTHRLRFTGKGLSMVSGSSSTSGSSTTGSSSSGSGTLNKTVQWNGVVNTKSDDLNVRKHASVEADECSFSPLPKGTVIGVCDSVTGTDGDTWYYIKYNGKYGYVHGDYVKKQSGTTTTATTATNSGVPNKTVQWNGKVSVNTELAVRQYPRNTANECTFSPLYNGYVVGVCDTVTGNKPSGTTSNIWYYIKYNGKYGYVHSDYVQKS